MLETLDRILSVGSWISSAIDLHDKYKTLCAIHHGETAFQKLDQKIERIAERILYAPDLQVVIDTNQTTQQVYRDHKQIHDALEPVQRALNQDILSSAMILTPEKMQQALAKNPWEVLHDVRPVDFFDSSRLPPEGVPVLFEHQGMKYLGWQLRGTLPSLFNCRYDELWLPKTPKIISNTVSKPTTSNVSKPTSTNEFIVYQNGKYSTINSALKEARNGDRIIVNAGLYKENIIIDKNIELIANGTAIIRIDGHCILMQAEQALVKGFTVQCRSGEKAAVYIPQGKLALENCDITSSASSCVEVCNQNTQAILRYCKIHDSKKGKGITVHSGAQSFIKGCKIYNNYESGVWLYHSNSNQIEDCDIFSNSYSISRYNTGAVSIISCQNISIRRCTIKKNEWHAISVENSKSVIVDDCDLRRNKRGAWCIEESSQVQKINNKDEDGLWIFSWFSS